MSREDRDIEVLKIILKHCNSCVRITACFGKDYNEFCENEIFYSSVEFQLYQAIEYTSHLSTCFRENHPEVPWAEIHGMRNFFAHVYEEMDCKKIWDTVINNIPELAEFCKKILAELSV